jgi:hypothetical protein
MKKILLFAVLLTISITHAQKELSKDYSYNVSAPYKVFDADEKLYFYRDNQILTVKIDNKEILLQKLESGSEKIVFKKEKLYESKKIMPKNFQVEGVEEFSGKYYFFYSSWDGDNDKEQLYAKEIDFAKGEFAGEDKLLFKVDGKIAGSPLEKFYFPFAPGINIGVKDKFDFIISEDKQKMLIEYRKKPEVRSDKKSWDVLGVHAFDAGLKEVWNNELKMPYTERRMDVLDYTIDKEANAYILAKVFHDDSNDDKKRKKDTEANYHVELFRIKANSDKVQITKIENKEKFINRLWLYESPDDYMLCAGFYNKGKNADNVDGLITFKVKKEGGIYDSTSHEIPLEVLNEHVKNRTKKKNERKDEDGEAEFSNLILDKIEINKDGSIVLMGEQYFVKTHYRANKINDIYYTYHYYDILVAKIDPAGKLAWMKKLPKKQVGLKGIGGMSYKHFFANNNHYLVFLDNVKNFNLPVDKTPALHSDGQGGYFTSYKNNDATGESVNSSIFNVRDIDDMTIYQFGINRILKTGEDEFAVEVYKKKTEDVMIKVKML